MQKKLKIIVLKLRLIGLLLILCLLLFLLFSCNGKTEEQDQNRLLPINNLPSLIYYKMPCGTSNAGI